VYGTLEVKRRLKNSAVGNPRFEVKVIPADPNGLSVVCRTKPNSDMAYGIENRTMREYPREWLLTPFGGHTRVEPFTD